MFAGQKGAAPYQAGFTLHPLHEAVHMIGVVVEDGQTLDIGGLG